MEQPKVKDNLLVNTSKPIKWVIPDSIRTDHATHLIVQQQGTEFILLFFEQETILFTGTQEEQIAAYKELPSLTAKCIAKIVMSVENIEHAANSLVDALNKMLQTISTKGEENAETLGGTEPSAIG